jgi:hypothetical protein
MTENSKNKIEVYDLGSVYSDFDLRLKTEIWYCELLFNSKVVGTIQTESKKQTEKLAKRWLLSKTV